MKRVAFYLRVSTGSQSTLNQELELKAVAEKSGWNVVRIYRDEGISGAKGRDRRPGFDSLCREAQQGRFDLIAAWSLDRLGRSLHDLVTFLNDLQARHVDLYLHRQALDSSTATGKAMLQMAGVFSEWEREVIRERVMAGLARAKAQGKKLGRRRTDRAIERKIERALTRGDMGVKKIARTVGVGVGTVQRVKAEMREQSRKIEVKPNGI